MSLDKNLFTLFFTPNKDHRNVIDLIDPSGTVHYRKQRVLTPEYKIEVYDPMSESVLATAAAPSASSKFKTVELCNPTSIVELKYTGTLSFRWAFKWEEHEFEWKREECFMIRKPDPPVIIAVTKEPAGRLKTISVQILDYNLNRFDINDRKGLEIVILTALLTFQDANEVHRNPEIISPPPTSNIPLNKVPPPVVPVGHTLPLNDMPPPPPPKPAPKTGVERIAELQAIKGEYNEIIISDEGSVHDYAEYCNNLLQDDAMLFITVKSAEAIQVPKVLQVVEETKRIRYKAGLSDEEELHQYVLYDLGGRKGPRRINLDDDMKNRYAPPTNLTVHLSKISMPELQPKVHTNEKQKEVKNKEVKKDATTTNLGKPASTPPAVPSRPSLSGSSSTISSSSLLKAPANKSQQPARSSSPNSRAYPAPTRLTKSTPNSNPPTFPVATIQQGQVVTPPTRPVSTTGKPHGFFDMLTHGR